MRKFDLTVDISNTEKLAKWTNLICKFDHMF